MNEKQSVKLAERFAFFSVIMAHPDYATPLLNLAEEHAKLERLRGIVAYDSDSRLVIEGRISMIKEEQAALFNTYFEEE